MTFQILSDRSQIARTKTFKDIGLIPQQGYCRQNTPYYYQQKLEEATKEEGGEIVMKLIHHGCFTKEMPLILKFPDNTNVTPGAF